jgi:hypothetical protein
MESAAYGVIEDIQYYNKRETEKLERGYQSNCKTDRYRLLRLLDNGRLVVTPPQMRRMWANRLLR